MNDAGPIFIPAERASAMSLRDYFAAKAMQALINAPYAAQLRTEAVAKRAYWLADDMLKAREQS